MSPFKRVAIIASVVVAVSIVGAVPVNAGVTPTTGEGETATLTITKTVVGEAPADAEFTIVVECAESGPYELTYGAAGGSQFVTFFGPDSCTISESDNGGASSTTGLGTIDIEDPILYARTVTNVFSAEPGSSSTSASVAADAATRPTFTG